jgi:hypothetical protein
MGCSLAGLAKARSLNHFNLQRMHPNQFPATVGLHQHARPIIIEDQELARPFARLSHARQLHVWGLGGLVTDALSCVLTRCYGADIEAHWHIGRYILPGNAHKVILKPKDTERLTEWH